MNEIQVARLRQERGWTQARLAAESRIGVRTVQRIEAGKHASLETLHLIAKAFDLPVRDLYVALDDGQVAPAGGSEHRTADRPFSTALTRARAGLGAIRRSLVLLVAVALLGAAVGTAIALTRPQVYEATAQAFVSVTDRTTGESLPRGASNVMRVAESDALVATAPIVLSRVRRDLSSEDTVGELADAVTVSVSVESNRPVVSVTARAGSPTSAARLADAVVNETAATVPMLNPASGATEQHVTPITRATPPQLPIGLMFTTGIGLLGGLVVAAVIVALRSRRAPLRQNPEASYAVATA